MYFVAAALTVLAGLFYAAGNHEIGSLGVDMCRYGGTFCDSPVYVLAGAILAALWGAFVSIR
jgi:hypothetical protein